MRRKTWLLTLVVLLLVVVGYGPWWRNGNPEQEQAFAEIQKQGGRVRIEGTTDGRQGITVSFSGPRATDAELASLQGLTQLHTLYLHDVRITDAGLAHLEGLSQLHTLSLLDTPVTDAGLTHLKGLGQLRELILAGTKITDAG